VAGVIIIARVSAVHPFVHGFRWPLSAAAGAQVVAFGLLVLGGAWLHPSLLLTAAALGIIQVAADYGTDSTYPIVLAAACVALIVAYRRMKVRLITLGKARGIVLAVAFAAALAGIIAMRAPTSRLTWEIDTTNGHRTTFRQVVDTQQCPLSVESKYILEQGCDVVIGARRAEFVIGYSAAAVIAGFAAAAGAAKWRDVI
jgi:hypothetical protein